MLLKLFQFIQIHLMGVYIKYQQCAQAIKLYFNHLDMQEKIVYGESDKNVSAQYNKQIDLAYLAKGIYYVKLIIDSEVQIQKVIIQ